jgi:Lon-like ATP-dependent protease
MQDRKVLAALHESRKRQAPYAGAFLLKDEPGTDPSVVSGSESEKNVYELKGKDLLNRLHEVGTLAQVSCRLEFLVMLSKNLYQLEKRITDNSVSIYIVMDQISSIQGDQVVLIGHRRLRITEIVSMKEPKSPQYFLVS